MTPPTNKERGPHFALRMIGQCVARLWLGFVLLFASAPVRGLVGADAILSHGVVQVCVVFLLCGVLRMWGVPSTLITQIVRERARGNTLFAEFLLVLLLAIVVLVVAMGFATEWIDLLVLCIALGLCSFLVGIVGDPDGGGGLIAVDDITRLVGAIAGRTNDKK